MHRAVIRELRRQIIPLASRCAVVQDSIQRPARIDAGRPVGFGRIEFGEYGSMRSQSVSGICQIAGSGREPGEERRGMAHLVIEAPSAVPPYPLRHSPCALSMPQPAGSRASQLRHAVTSPAF